MVDSTVDVEKSDAAEAFGALADEDRIGILLALWQSGSLSFVALQRSTGFEDSGRFNYHLNKLVDQFVTKADDDYRLTPVGAKAVDLLLDARFGQTPPPIDEPTSTDCPECNAVLHARYEDGDIKLQCTDCEVLVHYGYFPPRGRTAREVDGFLDAYSQRLWREFTLAQKGVCPHCSSRMQTTVDDDPDWYAHFAAKSTCEYCGAVVGSTLGLRLLADPDVVSFLADHDVHVDDCRFWMLDFCVDDSEVTVNSNLPRQYLLPIHMDRETLEVVVDDTATVVETARRSPR